MATHKKNSLDSTDSAKKTPSKTKESSESVELSRYNRRLNRIQGQILGIGKMIEDERTCVDILNQISAVKSALDGVAMAILEKQAVQCFQSPLDSEENKRSFQEFIDIVRKYAK